MNKFNFFRIIIILAYITFLADENISAQVPNSSFGDSLVLEQVIAIVLQSYPTVKMAEEALNAADAKIALAKSGLLPNVDASASFSNIGPVPSVAIVPGGPSFQLFPANNYSASLNFTETIFDFGRTSKSIQYETENKKLAEQGIDQVKQKLSITVVNTFFGLIYLQDGIEIKKQQLNALNEHLEFVQKKKATGSATQFEILTIQVKISGIESQLIDLETSRKYQLTILNTLMGQPEQMFHLVKKSFSAQLPWIKSDSMVNYAEQNRSEMKMARQKELIGKSRYDMIKAMESPTVNLFASGGGKNGYFMDLTQIRMNYVVGLNVRVPILDGKRTHNNLLVASSQIKSSGYETETTQRIITNEIVESQTKLSSSQKKLDQAALQLSQAEKAFSLAKVSYQSGVITNLDLLDATTSLAESRLQLLKARIDHAVSIYNFKIALGDKIY
jgi:outer membrane protein